MKVSIIALFLTVCMISLASGDSKKDREAYLKQLMKLIDGCAQKNPPATSEKMVKLLLHEAGFDSREEQCALTCILVEGKMINKDGTLNMKELKLLNKMKFINGGADTMTSIYEKCYKEVPKVMDPCTYTRDLYACVDKYYIEYKVPKGSLTP